MIESLGWVATAVFSLSYFVRRRRTMLAVQGGAALLWLTYGVLTHAPPIVAANVIVICAALVSVAREGRRRPADNPAKVVVTVPARAGDGAGPP